MLVHFFHMVHSYRHWGTKGMQDIKKNNQLKADVMMLFVTIFWGSSYLFMKVGLDSLGDFTLIALRFGIAFLLAGLLFIKRISKTNVKTIFYSFILGTILFIAFTALTAGMRSTAVSNTGFLVSLSVIFVPIISAVFFKQIFEKRLIIGVLTALLGIALLSLNSKLQLGPGDLLCILCALCYSFHIIITGKVTKHVDSIVLGVLQLGFCGAWGILFSFLFETPHLPNSSAAWASILALSIFCSALGFTIQTIAQQHTTATHTGLIFSLEPIFAAIFAFVFIGETLSTRGYIGAVVVFIGILIAEIDFSKILVKKKVPEQSTGTNLIN